MKRLDDAKRQVDAALTSSDEQDKFGLAVSSYFSEAQLLFDRIGAASNQMMARFVFEQTLAQNKQPAFRPFETKPLKKLQFPSMEDVEAANRRQICIWYAKLPTPQTTNSKEAMARIAERYKDFGGCTPAILREIEAMPDPPTKPKGAHKANQLTDYYLRAYFNEDNSHSPWSLAKRGALLFTDIPPGPMTKKQFAARLVPQFGDSADAILRRLKRLRTGH